MLLELLQSASLVVLELGLQGLEKTPGRVFSLFMGLLEPRLQLRLGVGAVLLVHPELGKFDPLEAI